MQQPPEKLGNDRIVRWTYIDSRHRPTENCRHVVAGQLSGSVSALAICQQQDNESCFLFYCDQEWNVVTDTWHETLEGALRQAEFEYEGVSKTWCDGQS